MNNPSASSSSSSTLHPLLQLTSATPSSSSRSLKRSVDQLSEFESSPPSKRVKEQMADDHIEVDDQLRVEKDETVVKMEEQTASKSESKDQAVENAIETVKAAQFVDAMEEELMCGCCAGLLYHPVVISPCGHYFCGACTVLWVRNGGTSCPACRQPSNSVQHSKLLEGFVEVLLRTYPEKQRSQAERDQADDVYSPSHQISIPPPKPATQDNVLLPQSRGHDPPPDNLARPCPHCLPNNEFGWRCPRPLADPQSDPEHAWNLDNGTPPGHAWCGTCDELHPVGSPSTTKCSVCETSFCGISVPHLCVANSMSSAHLPVAVSNLTGMIQSLEVYDAFNGNTTEVELLFDWLREDGRGPRGILLSMIEKVRASPSGFQALIDQGVFTRQPDDDAASEAPPPPPPAIPVAEPPFTDAAVQVPDAVPAPPAEPQAQDGSANTVPATGGDALNAVPGTPTTGTVPMPPPPAPPVPAPPSFTRICRECCHELFLYRLYEWWASERQAIVDAANAPPPPAAAEPPAAVPPPPADSSSDTDEDDEDDDDDGSQHSRPPSSSRNRTRTMLPAWVTNPERKDCPHGKMCGDQHSPSHAREFNHVILVRDPTQAPPQPPTTLEGVESSTQGEQAPSASQTGSLPTAPVPAPGDAPVAGSSAPTTSDVEMADNAAAAGRSKVEALLSNAVADAASSSSGLRVGGPVEEDATMEDADTANVDQSLHIAVGDRSSPPPAAGSSSMVVV
ncbi:hypothetical protein FRC04_009254 [Tulasnella sp. 424]|nr:hypothetical protein FRC04_009254 [Tulasnella sp. 424]KAG8958315.1 hypothetical protein FRC05_009078 [Tulasnella sp. 425]